MKNGPVQQLISLLIAGVTVGIATFAVLAISRIAGPFPLAVTQTTTSKQSTFDVSGTSKVTTIPDKATVSLGITVSESTVKAAQDKANSVINSINAELGKMGIEKKDIKTDSYSLYPNYDYQSGTNRITGYQVNASLSVSMKDFSKLNQAIDKATELGANQVNGIFFSLSDDKKKEVEEQARKEAIDDAKGKATELAGLAGMRLGKIVNVYESSNPNVYPIYAEAAMGMMKDSRGGAAGAPTNVEPGSTTFDYTVTISYETL